MGIRTTTPRASKKAGAPRPRRIAQRTAHTPRPTSTTPRARDLALATPGSAAGAAPALDLRLLDNVAVRVRARGAIGPAEVERRKRELLSAYAETRTRTEEETVALGDEILVDCVGYESGELVSARRGVWLTATPHEELPGLFEGIAGSKIGQQLSVPVTFGTSHPSLRLAGKTAVFVVCVHAAKEVIARDPAGLFAALGYGHTADEVDAAIAEELKLGMGQAMVREAEEKVLRKLQQRRVIPVPETAVRESLRDMWQAHAAEWVCAGAPDDQIARLRDQFFADPHMRQEATYRAFCGRFLDAVAGSLSLQVTTHDMFDNLRKALAVTDLAPTAQDQALQHLESQKRTLLTAATRQRALEAVLERVAVQFV